MIFTANTLPDDVETLKAMLIAEYRRTEQLDAKVADQQRRAAELDALVQAETARAEKLGGKARLEEARADRLENILREMRRALFGRRSEKLSADQLEMLFEDVETVMEAVEAELDASRPTPREKTPARINRGRLPAHLPRIEEVIEPEASACGCGGALHRIGDDVSERLDIAPARFRVLVTRRPKYGCRRCEEGVVQAPSPARLIEGGLPTESTVAHVLVSKYADHLPLYRQAQIFSRQGVTLDRSTLAHWVGQASFMLRPVFEALAANLRRSSKLFMDETPAPVLDAGRGRTKTGYLWALARDDRPWGGSDPPGVVYFYADGRGGAHAERFLAGEDENGFSGVLQVDGYGGYRRLAEGGAITLAFCWAHARRKLYEVEKGSGSAIAAEGLRRIAELYRIESEIRGRPPNERLAERTARSTPRLAAFKDWITDARARVSGKSRLGEALRYIERHWDGLTRFLEDGRIELDSNAVERSMRPIALTRKNALFAGHDEGARNWGVVASLIETAKLNGVDPHAYLERTLRRIVDGHPQSRIDDLLPWAFQD